jgi:L-asparaginase / beta-aspartyl-peptidase
MLGGKMGVILHGGAGGFLSEEDCNVKEPYLKEALDAAWGALSSGDSGERAVVAALKVLEGCEYFDAGYGSFPNEHGNVFLDVALMRGNGDFISLMNVRRLRYPSQLALDMFRPGRSLQRVWTERLQRGVEASDDQLKERYGFARTEEEMISPYAVEANRRHRQKVSKGTGTVGCVVRDKEGRIFAGTSTGGTPNKPDGRIGDSPIVGAGVFADDEICGLSATGHGETILKSMVSGMVVASVRQAMRNQSELLESSLRKILADELDEMSRKYPNAEAGIVLIPQSGPPVYAFSAETMC